MKPKSVYLRFYKFIHCATKNVYQQPLNLLKNISF